MELCLLHKIARRHLSESDIQIAQYLAFIERSDWFCGHVRPMMKLPVRQISPDKPSPKGLACRFAPMFSNYVQNFTCTHLTKMDVRGEARNCTTIRFWPVALVLLQIYRWTEQSQINLTMHQKIRGSRGVDMCWVEKVPAKFACANHCGIS